MCLKGFDRLRKSFIETCDSIKKASAVAVFLFAQDQAYIIFETSNYVHHLLTLSTIYFRHLHIWLHGALKVLRSAVYLKRTWILRAVGFLEHLADTEALDRH